jgi:ArsR family transcriptional regulator, arsenate/arsenite/antimonite-responsive transcriptional repressor
MTQATPNTLSLRERARLFQALSDETRLAILDLLRGGERCVCDLQDDLDAAQSRLSFHLRVLREAGLVTDHKAGRWSYYTLVPERLKAVVEAISGPSKGSRAPRSARLHQLARRRPSLANASVRPEVAGECCP